MPARADPPDPDQDDARALRVLSPPTYVYVFRSSASFDPYRLGKDGKPRSIAGYFAPSIEGNDAALQALRHLLASTVGLGLSAGILPAWFASRTSILDGLRKV